MGEEDNYMWPLDDDDRLDERNILTTITGVAIQHNDQIFSLPKPFRHHHVIKVMVVVCNFPTPITSEQGFVDENGNFINRKDAAKIVLETGQCKVNHPPNLYSEDLW